MDIQAEHNGAKSVVAVEVGGSRELLWLAPDSPVLRWQIGDAVVYRRRQWRVTGRVQHDRSLILTLGRPD